MKSFFSIISILLLFSLVTNAQTYEDCKKLKPKGNIALEVGDTWCTVKNPTAYSRCRCRDAKAAEERIKREEERRMEEYKEEQERIKREAERLTEEHRTRKAEERRAREVKERGTREAKERRTMEEEKNYAKVLQEREAFWNGHDNATKQSAKNKADFWNGANTSSQNSSEKGFWEGGTMERTLGEAGQNNFLLVIVANKIISHDQEMLGYTINNPEVASVGYHVHVISGADMKEQVLKWQAHYSKKYPSSSYKLKPYSNRYKLEDGSNGFYNIAIVSETKNAGEEFFDVMSNSVKIRKFKYEVHFGHIKENVLKKIRQRSVREIINLSN